MFCFPFPLFPPPPPPNKGTIQNPPYFPLTFHPQNQPNQTGPKRLHTTLPGLDFSYLNILNSLSLSRENFRLTIINVYWQKEAKDLEEERDSILIEEEDSLKNYYDLLQQYKSLKKDVRDILFSPRYCLPFLQASRLVCIQCYKSEEASPSFSMKDEVTWGVILNFERVKSVSEGENCQWALIKQVHLP